LILIALARKASAARSPPCVSLSASSQKGPIGPEWAAHHRHFRFCQLPLVQAGTNLCKAGDSSLALEL